MKLIVAMLLLAGSALAQQSCPVQPTYFHNYGNEFRVQWKNTSDRPTDGIRFGAYYTSVGEKHDFFEMLEYNVRPGSTAYKKPAVNGGKSASSWYILQDRTNSGGVWVDKVTFRDGSVWQDDGSRSCVFEANK